MLYDVWLWLTLAHLDQADITCRVDAKSVDDAACCALRRYHLTTVAYAWVSALEHIPGTIVSRQWGPVSLEVR